MFYSVAGDRFNEPFFCKSVNLIYPFSNFLIIVILFLSIAAGLIFLKNLAQSD